MNINILNNRFSIIILRDKIWFKQYDPENSIANNRLSVLGYTKGHSFLKQNGEVIKELNNDIRKIIKNGD